MDLLKRGSLLIGLLLVLWTLSLAQVPDAPASGPGTKLTLLEALESTLANQPQLHLEEQQVEISRALKQQASGQFDLVVGSNFSQNHLVTPLTLYEQELAAVGGSTSNNLAQNLSTFNAGVTKLFRDGITISPTYQTIRTTDNSTTTEGTNVSQLMFQVQVPLLRGRGRDVVDAQETAADIEVNATLLDLNQTISSLFSGTSTAYWNAVAAERALEVAKASEERGGVYVDTVQTLINADRLARTEINQAIANLAGRMADRVSAEQTLIGAQQQLALAMGLTTDQIPSVGYPSEDFPHAGSGTLPVVDSTLTKKYVQTALQRRADYLASQRRVGEASVLLAPARNQLKPQVNLNLDTGISGLSEGTGLAQFFASPYHSIKGLDALAGITYSFPPRNDLAAGQLRQAQAALSQAEIKRGDTARNISSAVVIALNGVHNAIVQVLKSRESVEAFQAALDGEREKFHLGVNSLTDVLTVEDRLTTAMQSQVSAELAYALALTQLRWATGTIVEPDQAVQSVDRNVFFNMP